MWYGRVKRIPGFARLGMERAPQGEDVENRGAEGINKALIEWSEMKNNSKTEERLEL